MYAAAVLLALASLASAQNTTCTGGITQPVGAGPVASPDTPAAFLALSALGTAATNAATPAGYTLAFANLKGAIQNPNYLGYYTLASYSPAACAAHCASATGCSSFNTCKCFQGPSRFVDFSTHQI